MKDRREKNQKVHRPFHNQGRQEVYTAAQETSVRVKNANYAV